MYVSNAWTVPEIKRFSRMAHDVARGSREAPIVAFSRHFGRMLHSNAFRDNGRPYTEHLVDVAGKTRQVVAGRRHENAAVSAGYLHDAHEDIVGVLILDMRKVPVSEFARMGKRSGKLVLNQELLAYGEEGLHASFMIYAVTREKHNRTKFDYMNNILGAVDSPETKLIGELATVSLIVKGADIDSNTDPDEEYSPEHDLNEARGENENGRGAIIQFLKRKMVVDAFFKDSRFIGFDDGLFVAAMRDRFETKKIRFASDNLTLYLPQMEERLLIRPGLKRGRFDVKRADDCQLYDYKEARALLKSIYNNSISILGTLKFPGGTPLYFAMEAGTAKTVRYPGYRSIITEIRLEKAGISRRNQFEIHQE